MAEDYKAAVARFVTEHVLGNERAIEAFTGDVPGDAAEAFHRAGLANWWISPGHGGRGLSMADSVDIVEELAYGDAGLAFSLFISILCTNVLELYGTPEQKARYLDGFASGGHYAAMLGSEREAGSELLRTSTTSLPAAGGWMIRGDKFFSTNAAFAELLIVLAATTDDPVSFQAVVLPKGTPGVTMLRRWNVLGVRASAQYEVRLEDVRVPADALIPVNGVRALEVGLNFSRVLIAATAIGVSRRIRDLGLQYAQTKKVKDAPLRQNAVFMAKLGQIEAEIDCMRAVCKAAARDLDDLRRLPDAPAQLARAGTLKSALVAKLLCGQIGWKVASAGSELFGSLGYTDDLLVEKLLRDVRFVAIVEGGEDVLRELIFARFVKAIVPR